MCIIAPKKSVKEHKKELRDEIYKLLKDNCKDSFYLTDEDASHLHLHLSQTCDSIPLD